MFPYSYRNTCFPTNQRSRTINVILLNFVKGLAGSGKFSRLAAWYHVVSRCHGLVEEVERIYWAAKIGKTFFSFVT